MAFQLNVGDPFQAKPSLGQATSAVILETRQGLRSRKVRRYADLPALQAATAIAVFVLGYSVAMLRPHHAGVESYDMSPTGSIVRSAATAAPKQMDPLRTTSCN